jgi:hypothetical protein
MTAQGKALARSRRPKTTGRHLRKLIEEAVVDCYTEEEQHGGFLVMFQDHVACPFRALVVGEEVEVRGFDWDGTPQGIVAVCRRKGRTHRVNVTTLEWIGRPPVGAERAIGSWRRGGCEICQSLQDHGLPPESPTFAFLPKFLSEGFLLPLADLRAVGGDRPGEVREAVVSEAVRGDRAASRLPPLDALPFVSIRPRPRGSSAAPILS